MPHKSDYSHLMTTKEFFAKWTTWEPLIYRVVLSHIQKFPLHDAPGFGAVEDVVGEIRSTMHRLGIFARWNPMIQDEKKYVGCQALSIMKHMWQDHCRLNKRFRISLHTVEASDDRDLTSPMNLVDNGANHDPNFNWTLGASHTDDSTSERMVLLALETELKTMNSSKKNLALKAVALLKKSPSLASAPTTKALAAAMCLEESMAATIKDLLKEAAQEVLAY